MVQLDQRWFISSDRVRRFAVAALQASQMGAPVYRRMGYVEVTRYPSFVRMDAPPASSSSQA